MFFIPKKRSFFPGIFVCFLLLLTLSQPLQAQVIASQAADTDQTLYKIGLALEGETRTIRIQAIKGEWTVILHPAPPASMAEALFSQETAMSVMEGEDFTLELLTKGIIAKTSQGQELTAGYSLVELKGGELLGLEIPGQPQKIFQGKLEVLSKEKSLFLQNTLPLKQLLISSLSITAPSSEPEAIKAQIVAARTFALAARETPRHASETYDFCHTQHCFEFDGSAKDRDLIKVLIEQVPDQILTFKGKPFTPYYHHTCGGKISSAKDIFGLADEVHIAHEDRAGGKGAENCFHSPSFSWVREFSKEEIVDFLAVTYAGGGDNIFLRWDPIKVDPYGRIIEVKLMGNREKYVSGIEFFHHLLAHFGPNSFKSMKFTSQSMRQTTIFRGTGEGYGVGMCLMGADGLAKKGWDYKRILGFYYPGTAIVNKPGKPEESSKKKKDS